MDERPRRHDDDLALVSSVVAGDATARLAVVARMERVFSARIAHLRRRAPALRAHEDDLRQRFVLRMLDNGARYLASYAGQAPLDGWLGVVAFRWLRREAGTLAKNKEQPLELSPEAPATGETPEEAVLRRSQAAAVHSAVAELEDRDRTLLALLFEQDVPAHAAGRILGLTPSGVRMRKSRLLAKLAQKLRHLAPGEEP